MHIPVPIADVVDRITILNLKIERIGTPRCRHERDALLAAWSEQQSTSLAEVPGLDDLAAVNAALWDVEDRLRIREDQQDFGPDFVTDARSVYRLNDRRAALKRAINEALESEFVEEKSYG